LGESSKYYSGRSDEPTRWNYVIGGAPRAGKSTLANSLQLETGGTIVRGDALMTAFTATALESGVPPGSSEPYDTFFLSSLICRYARNLSRSEPTSVILEGIGLQPESIDKTQLRRAGFRIVFLGYPYTTVAEKIASIRRCAKNDPLCWSHGVSELRLREIINQAISDSLQTRVKCFKLGLPFYDTGKDFDAVIAAARDRLLVHATGCQTVSVG
jgi:gluconate kinase